MMKVLGAPPAAADRCFIESSRCGCAIVHIPGVA